MKFTIQLYSLFLLLILPIQVSFAQFKIPPVPSLQTSVYDYAKVLSDVEKTALEEKLIRYSDSTTTQIVVITIEDLKGENIGLLAPRWGQEWGIGGSKEQDNGVVILLSKNDRRIHISPGYGVEDRLTAGITGELVRNVILPEFKAGSYYQGLDKGADAIFEVLKGKYKGSRNEPKSGIPIIFVLLFFVILFLLISKGSKNNRNGGTGSFSGSDLANIIILSSLGRGGFGGGGGSSSGGGFGGGGFGGGFGGGGFSGGGAGGSW